jgi:hypothetical protein
LDVTNGIRQYAGHAPDFAQNPHDTLRFPSHRPASPEKCLRAECTITARAVCNMRPKKRVAREVR